MTGIIITCYNRPEYLKRCLESVAASDLSGCIVMLIDDASDDALVRSVMADFKVKGISIIHLLKGGNQGVKKSLLDGFDTLFNKGCEHVINLDSDAIVKPGWVKVLLNLKSEHPNHIVSGFNSKNTDSKGQLRNPIVKEGDSYLLKKHCNGINMCLNKTDYETYVRPALQKEGNWDFNSTNKDGFIIAKPSVVQHIGLKSSMGHNDNPDVACDFKLLSLPSVMLFGIDAHDVPGIKRAADICKNDVEFGAEKIITERLFSGREAYSKFMISDLWEHVKDNDCTHVLTIHADGFIQNPLAWDEEWLKLDYLGATWVYKDGKNVGNGGFSLRSKKFIESCSQLDISDYHPEDCLLSRRYRPFLEKEYGLIWGTEEQANRFSIEAYGCGFMKDTDGIKATQYSGSFGFHGYGVTGLPIQPAQKQVISVSRPRAGIHEQRRGIR